jgi:hypothetical protein
MGEHPYVIAYVVGGNYERRENEREGIYFPPFLRKYTENGLFLYNQKFCSIEYIFSICLGREAVPSPLSPAERGTVVSNESGSGENTALLHQARLHNSEHTECSFSIRACPDMNRVRF